jgi:hypothetical protein
LRRKVNVNINVYRTLMVVVLLLTAFVAVPASAATTNTYTNPIKSQKGADPWLEYYSGNYSTSRTVAPPTVPTSGSGPG